MMQLLIVNSSMMEDFGDASKWLLMTFSQFVLG
jgi:hypothetical protein